MIARIATGLKKLPAEVRTMTLPQVYDLFAYWNVSPPEHEMLSMLARIYTTWKPGEMAQAGETEEMRQRRSLEHRWNSGYLNVEQMFKAAGGGKTFNVTALKPGQNPPGIGPFPGMKAAA